VAEGPDPFVAVDPDGDPIDGYQLGAAVAPERTASRGTVTRDGIAHEFRFETPTTLPLEFRSANGTSGFTVSASVSDSFGAIGEISEQVHLSNRAPVVVEAAPTATVPHSYGAADRRYRATVNGAVFEDPDGDPLLPTATGLAWCSSVSLQEGRAVTACERAWDYTLGGVPPLSELLKAGTITVGASDGWAFATSATAVTFLDRPGSISAPITSVEHCECLPSDPPSCSKYAVSQTGVPIPVELRDDDGDPYFVG